MVERAIQQIQVRLRKSLRSGQEEWDIIQELLPSPETERLHVLEWVLENYVGYVDPRVHAGLEVMAKAPDRAWSILSCLVQSTDPDDRDTAFGVLELVNNDQAMEMAKPLLDDEYPYIRLEAARFLRNKYPEEVRATLTEFLRDRASQMRAEAEEIIQQMKTGS